MTIAQEVFSRRTPVYEQLTAHGFVRRGDAYCYRQDVLEGQFAVEVTVGANGRVASRVVDCESGEEYVQVNVEWSTGAFVGAVRQAYREVLEHVADACFRREYFASDQANRIAQAVYARYGERPDFPFDTAKTYGVFRYPLNAKWYGLIMDVPLSRVTKAAHAEDPVVDILNLKIDPTQREQLLRNEGFYTCYHMNKKEWISIVLDDTTGDDEILSLLDSSRGFVTAKAKKR